MLKRKQRQKQQTLEEVMDDNAKGLVLLLTRYETLEQVSREPFFYHFIAQNIRTIPELLHALEFARDSVLFTRLMDVALDQGFLSPKAWLEQWEIRFMRPGLANDKRNGLVKKIKKIFENNKGDALNDGLITILHELPAESIAGKFAAAVLTENFNQLTTKQLEEIARTTDESREPDELLLGSPIHNLALATLREIKRQAKNK